jgi:hypothetical protein
MRAFDPAGLSPPSGLQSWISKAAAAWTSKAERTQWVHKWIHDQQEPVPRQWWSAELKDKGLHDSVISNVISRADLFALAEDALESPDGALTLLWNAVAWGTGGRSRNNRRRITSVSADPDGIGTLLQRAAMLSRSDPRAAYLHLRPNQRNVIPYLGPAYFTKFLYFAGRGAGSHPCYILDSYVARSLRNAGWRGMLDTNWPADTYVAYTELIRRWHAETDSPRADLIERWLYNNGQPSKASAAFSVFELRVISTAMSIAAGQSAELSAQPDFLTVRAKVEDLLGEDVDNAD